MQWYQVHNENEIDSPALLIYPDRIQHNINCMIEKVGGDPSRLFPHVKTHKMREVVRMQLDAGVTQFKCATIAELEMILEVGAKKVLIAYQLNTPKISRYLKLVRRFPEAVIASLVDNLASANKLADAFGKVGLIANVYLDIDNGQHRTGFRLDDSTFSMVENLTKIKNLCFKGLHVYDGHFRSNSYEERKNAGDKAFFPVYALVQRIENELLIQPEVINGGSPAFSAAAQREGVFCSPGTILLWDYGYSQMISEITAKWAAVLLTRVISKPTEGIITMDLGHKSVGSENPLKNRIHFLNLNNYKVIGQSEEHLVLKVENWEQVQVGDVFYGIPFHVCPSVALYNEAHIIRNNEWVENWEIVARRRRISV